MVSQPDVRPEQTYAAAELAHRHGEARKRMAESPVHPTEENGKIYGLEAMMLSKRSQPAAGLLQLCRTTQVYNLILPGFLRGRGVGYSE